MPVSPLDAATDVLARARGLLELDEPSIQETVRADLRRTALALGVASLDTYLHWAIRRVSFTSPLPQKLAELAVDFGVVLALADASVEARKKGIANRPQVTARNALNEQLLTMTFQSARQVEHALQMLGIAKCWIKLSAAIAPPATAAELQNRLNHLSHRRNKIVHEGGLLRLKKPQAIQYESITREEVIDDLDWIESFTKALATVVT